MKFFISLHPMEFTSKPSGSIVANISKEIADYPIELNIHQLRDELASGKTWTPAIFNGERNANNFIQQQVIVADIDSGNPSKEQILSDLADEGLVPNLMHESFSSTPEKRKWRLVFLLSEPLQLTQEVKTLTKWIASIVEGDTAVADTARLLYSTNKGCELLSENSIDVDWLLDKCENSVYYVNQEEERNVEINGYVAYPKDEKQLYNKINNLTPGKRAIFELILKDVQEWIEDPTIKGSGYETVFKSVIHLASVRWMPLWVVEFYLNREMDKHDHFGPMWRHFNKKDRMIKKAYNWARTNCEKRL